ARSAFHRARFVHRVAELRREHDVLAAGSQKPAEAGFRAAFIAVNVGRIEERDPEIERLVYDGFLCFGVDPQYEVVAPETEQRNPGTVCAESTFFHQIASVGIRTWSGVRSAMLR